MGTSIVREVPGHENEIGMGVIASTPPHYVVAWGEYAADGEADGEIRIMSAVDEGGNDITSLVAEVVAQAVDSALDRGAI